MDSDMGIAMTVIIGKVTTYFLSVAQIVTVGAARAPRYRRGRVSEGSISISLGFHSCEPHLGRFRSLRAQKQCTRGHHRPASCSISLFEYIRKPWRGSSYPTIRTVRSRDRPSSERTEYWRTAVGTSA